MTVARFFLAAHRARKNQMVQKSLILSSYFCNVTRDTFRCAKCRCCEIPQRCFRAGDRKLVACTDVVARPRASASASRESTVFFIAAVVNDMKCVSIRDRTETETSAILRWLGGQQMAKRKKKAAAKKKARRRSSSLLTLVFDLRHSLSQIASYGPVCVTSDERIAVTPRRPGSNDDRGRRRDFQSLRRPQSL